MKRIWAKHVKAKIFYFILHPSAFILFLWLAAFHGVSAPAAELLPIPDKLVVLTFDDSVKSQVTFVAPLLKKLGFGATFFITEGFDFPTDKTHYMTWEDIRGLHDAGFEIGNHTRNHKGVNSQSREEFKAALEYIEQQCEKNGIPRPVSFAFPGNALDRRAVDVLIEKGYKFARRGGAPEFPYEKGEGRAYDPKEDHPLLIPSAGDARPDWKLENFIAAATQAKDGKFAIIQFHGVPDTEHPWVNSDPAMFESYMKYLKDNGYKVIALRDLGRYVDPNKRPADPFAAIERRTKAKPKKE